MKRTPSQLGRMRVNKGKVGERAWAAYLRNQYGWDAKRGAQHAGGVESPDVRCEQLDGVHGEVKYGYPLMRFHETTQAMSDAITKAKEDGDNRPWYIAWKPLGASELEWRVSTMFHGTFVTVVNPTDILTVLKHLCHEADARLPLTDPGATA